MTGPTRSWAQLGAAVYQMCTITTRICRPCPRIWRGRGADSLSVTAWPTRLCCNALSTACTPNRVLVTGHCRRTSPTRRERFGGTVMSAADSTAWSASSTKPSVTRRRYPTKSPTRGSEPSRGSASRPNCLRLRLRLRVGGGRWSVSAKPRRRSRFPRVSQNDSSRRSSRDGRPGTIPCLTAF